MSQDQWLIRTAKNILTGPYTREQVCQFIREGQLGLEDEVCRANHYWILLSERDEVSRQLGIEMPVRPLGGEMTRTQTLIEGSREVTKTLDQASLQRPSNAARAPDGGRPDLQGRPARFRPKQIERPTIYRGIIWLALGTIILLLFFVFRILRN